MKLSGDIALKELYGVEPDKLTEFSKFCKAKGVDWFTTFYLSQDDEDAFIQYLEKKYKCGASEKRGLPWLILDYSPTSNLEVFEKASKVVKRTKLWKEIEAKRWKAKPIKK